MAKEILIIKIEVLSDIKRKRDISKAIPVETVYNTIKEAEKL